MLSSSDLKDLLMLRAVSKNGEDLVQSFLITNRRLDLTSSIYSRFSERAYQVRVIDDFTPKSLFERRGVKPPLAGWI